MGDQLQGHGGQLFRFDGWTRVSCAQRLGRLVGGIDVGRHPAEHMAPPEALLDLHEHGDGALIALQLEPQEAVSPQEHCHIGPRGPVDGHLVLGLDDDVLRHAVLPTSVEAVRCLRLDHADTLGQAGGDARSAALDVLVGVAVEGRAHPVVILVNDHGLAVEYLEAAVLLEPIQDDGLQQPPSPATAVLRALQRGQAALVGPDRPGVTQGRQACHSSRIAAAHTSTPPFPPVMAAHALGDHSPTSTSSVKLYDRTPACSALAYCIDQLRPTRSSIAARASWALSAWMRTYVFASGVPSGSV